MIDKIFKTPIPSWVILLFLAVVIVGTGLFINYFGEVTYNYDLQVSNREDGNDVALEYGAWPDLANADFFDQVKEDMISQKADFILGDLSQMTLEVYKNGVSVRKVPILSKGREGSWWETPAGIYRIQSKEKSHFSSFGGVYMPWSMAFQGNFFIHGWPYYPGGNDVAEGFSGGCIRLSTDDAELVYDLVNIGTPVLVYESYFEKDNFNYVLKVPDVSAKAFLAVDLKSNFAFLERNSRQVKPVASITKLVSAVVVTEYINLEKEITITESMLATTSLPRFKPGDRFSAFDLLFPLLMESSNEAAMGLASFLGRNRFVQLMNSKAESLGMFSSVFSDPAGLDEENTSTAEDLFNLAKYIYNNRNFVFKVSAGNLVNLAYGFPDFKNLKNFNIFSEDSSFVGGKVGETSAAGQTFLGVFELSFGGEKRPIAIIVLDSSDNEGDVRKILNYVKSNYSSWILN